MFFVSDNKMNNQLMNDQILSFAGITLSKSDLKCLEAYNFLNDQIINFFLRNMHHQLLSEEQQKQAIVADTYFKDAIISNCPERLYRWLHRIPVFDANYLIIPVNIKEHWCLMVVSHPNYLWTNNGGKKTIIYTMDSMSKTYGMEEKVEIYNGLFAFLQAACYFKHGYFLSNIEDRIDLKQINVKLQDNLYDCGIHLLINVETFLVEAYSIAMLNDDNDDNVFWLCNEQDKREAMKNYVQRLSKKQQREIDRQN